MLPSAMPALDATRHTTTTRNKRRSRTENWFKKIGRYCKRA